MEEKDIKLLQQASSKSVLQDQHLLVRKNSSFYSDDPLCHSLVSIETNN